MYSYHFSLEKKIPTEKPNSPLAPALARASGGDAKMAAMFGCVFFWTGKDLDSSNLHGAKKK